MKITSNDSVGAPPYKVPIEPVELTSKSEFQFDCFKGISCFNECCRSIDITLTPYDIVQLKNYFQMESKEFVGRYTTPFAMDHHDLPGLKLNTKPGTTECVFLSEEGCTVYADRPAACRYYALGNMGVRKKDSAIVEDIFFVVKEDHCRGHEQSKKQTVDEYRHNQGVDKYDDMNSRWREIVLRKRSSGPTVGRPTDRSMQLFDMCSYDLDSFREFIQTESFQDVFDLSEDEMHHLTSDEEMLLDFAMRYLNQVLFGIITIDVRTDARERRLARLAQRKKIKEQNLN